MLNILLLIKKNCQAFWILIITIRCEAFCLSFLVVVEVDFVLMIFMAGGKNCIYGLLCLSRLLFDCMLCVWFIWSVLF